MEYEAFLARKRRLDPPTGIDVPASALNPELFPFQRDIVRWSLRRGRAAVFADCGLGKGQPVTSSVLTPSGWRSIGDLVIGDRVIGKSGAACNVTGVFPRGELPVYRVTFCDGTSIVCDADHLWSVRTNSDKFRGKAWRTMRTEDLIKSGLHYGKGDKSRKWRIPLADAIQLEPTTALTLHPYLLGVMLGDGSMIATPAWHKDDQDIADRIGTMLPAGVALSCRSDGHRCKKWSFVNHPRNPHVRNPVALALEQLELMGTTAETKFVPTRYLFGTIAERVALLQGLMDTDGYCGDPTPEFSSASEKLARAVVFLVQSLGGVASLAKKAEPSYRYKGEDRVGLPSWRVNMSLPSGVNPFSLPRKAKKYRPTSRGLGRWIKSIEPCGTEPVVCIAVDAPDHLYVTEHCVVTHNTFMQLEWAKHIPGRVLILTPLAVARQTQREGERFGIPARVVEHPADVGDGISITNYAKLHRFLGMKWAGIVADESGILKHHDAATRNLLIEEFARTPFRLACTATPAPNDHMELGSHAEFLGVMTRAEMLAMFFVHDGGETQKWRMKGHAESEFWRWMCSWAVMLRKPSDLGYENDGFDLPPLVTREHVVAFEDDPHRRGQLFALPAETLDERRGARRASLDARVAKAAELANGDDEQWLIWCDLNDEGNALERSIRGAVQIAGADDDETKIARMAGFIDGTHRVLVSKPSIAGHGVNLQNCCNEAFVGLSDSYEQLYQAIRRCWRFGQTRPVNVHIITSPAEGNVLANIKRKDDDANRMAEGMVKHMADISSAEIRGSQRTESAYATDVQSGEGWALRLGDCVEVVGSMMKDSIGFSVFSPPFSSLYTYSNSDRDMGNCSGDAEFAEHFGYLIGELLRVTMPGRLCSFHCMNLPTSKERDGYIGIRDFRGALIRQFERAGWIYHSEVCIWKDPVTAMQRTKALGLLHKQIKKDSCMSRQGIADYLVTMRKPGDNPERVAHTAAEFPVSLWQRYASPVWMDINPSDTLQFMPAREENDERHIAPLQLQVIERAIDLWTNRGDLVLDPFTGIGSTGYVALKRGRRFVGAELKRSYWELACKHLRTAEREARERTLFSGQDPEPQAEAAS